ncbi:Putative deoxyribonuclease TATDN2, partial [Araneus ventricosus]
HSSEQYSSTSTLSSYKSGSTGRISQDMLEQSNFQPDGLQSLSSRSASMISESTMGFFDSHCHLDILFQNEQFGGTYSEYMVKHRQDYPDSFKGCIAVFCKPFTFAKVSMWQKLLAHEKVWGAFGVHPKNAKEYNRKIENYLISALNHPKVKALGEIGLDYSDR